jgi:hypothetical protein
VSDESLKRWSVHAHVTHTFTAHVSAKTSEGAALAIRERLAADYDSARYGAEGAGGEDDDRVDLHRPEEVSKKAIESAEYGRTGAHTLTDAEVAYCEGRGYGTGHDTDAYPGMQWSHLVDDSVALCRTTALWLAGDTISKDRQLSCPFCRELLRREMRYEHLELHIESRLNRRQTALARIEYRDDGVALIVNDVKVREVREVPLPDYPRESGVTPEMRAYDDAVTELYDLQSKINRSRR